jgi:uncharacterized protein YbjT (DUF2867 family)
MRLHAGSPVLVIGGTRGTGKLIAERLLLLGVPVQVLARNASGARKRFPPEVEIIPGDLTKPRTLAPAIRGAGHIVFTAGCRSGRPASEAKIRAIEYAGTLETLGAAREAGFGGRFLYMTASGVGRPSLLASFLNRYKGNTLKWRSRAEEAIRASPLDYTIIRTGVLLNRPGGNRAVQVTQAALPLSFRYRIARADVADGFVAALTHPRTVRTTFEIVWGKGPRREGWPSLLDRLSPDSSSGHGNG